MTKHSPPRFSLPALCTAVLLAVLLGQSQVIAQAMEMEVTVREIVADNSGQGLDSKLGDIGKDLKKLTYTTYRLEKTHDQHLDGNAQSKIVLLGDNVLLLSSEGEDEGKLRLKVKLTPGDSKARSFESTLRIPDGGTFIIGGPAYGDGVLILAFTAKK
jgi:hypothetical protein